MGQARGPRLGPGLKVIHFDAIQVGQGRIPVVGVAFQLPHHPSFQAFMAERPGARIHRHAAQIVIVFLQRLLTHDDIEARGQTAQQKAPGLGETELHR